MVARLMPRLGLASRHNTRSDKYIAGSRTYPGPQPYKLACSGSRFQDPILLATMGSGLPVHQAPLHTKPDSTPRPAFTEHELIFFRGGEAYTSMVNAKLAE